jgi:hypothetical protein
MSLQDRVSTAPADRDTATVLVLAGATGLALGVADLLLIRLLPYPLADLANSSAMWALAAFVLGRLLRAGPVVGAAAGAVLLVVGVEAYYLAATVVDLASPGSLVTPTTLAWCVMAVLAGSAFGAAGAWSLEPDTWRPAIGVALVVGVVVAEAWLRRALPDTSLLTAAVGLTVLVSASRGPVEAARAAALAVPTTLLCVLGFAVAGF